MTDNERDAEAQRALRNLRGLVDAPSEWRAEYRRDWETVAAALSAATTQTEQRWWQQEIEPGRRAGLIETRFLPGRPRFDVPEGTYTDPRGNRPPFGCVVVIWRRAAAVQPPEEQRQ